MPPEESASIHTRTSSQEAFGFLSWSDEQTWWKNNRLRFQLEQRTKEIPRSTRLPSASWRLLEQLWAERIVFQWESNSRTRLEILAQIEHFWPNGSAAVSVHHDRIGWLEFDILEKSIPEGARPQDQFEVVLKLDAKGQVVSHQILPGAKVIRPTKPSVGEMLEARLPKQPANMDDEAEVARYQRELETWDRNSGLGRRPPNNE